MYSYDASNKQLNINITAVGDQCQPDLWHSFGGVSCYLVPEP